MLRIVFFLALWGVAHAQDDAATPPAAEPASESAVESKDRVKALTPDSFNPTEKLSEDVPAAFPIDI